MAWPESEPASLVRRSKRNWLSQRQAETGALPLPHPGEVLRQHSTDRSTEAAPEGTATADSGSNSRKNSGTPRSARLCQRPIDQDVRGSPCWPGRCFANGLAGFLSYLPRRQDSRFFSHAGVSRIGCRTARRHLHERNSSRRMERSERRCRSAAPECSTNLVCETAFAPGRAYLSGARQCLHLPRG